jgi:hypothetical protein
MLGCVLRIGRSDTAERALIASCRSARDTGVEVLDIQQLPTARWTSESGNGFTEVNAHDFAAQSAEV